MYIAIIPNRSSPPAVLLRESYREGGKVKNRTLANLSHLPAEQIELLRRVFKGEPLVPPDEAFRVLRSRPHGHVHAVLGTLRKLGLEQIISAKPSPERDLVVAMIVQRVIDPASKLGTTRLWHTTSLAQELGVSGADEDDLYAAMDWLLARQARIEQQLAQRHLEEGGLALYDVSSSYYEGSSCPLARYGYNRDEKQGRKIIVYGVLTNAEGCPVAVSVYPGDTADPLTVGDQIRKLRERFGLQRLVLVGDRGMLTQARIEELQGQPGVGWISALRSCAIRKLLRQETIQPSLFDQRNLAEISSPEFPGERLVACFNPLLAEKRKRKREALLAATEKELTRIQAEVRRRTRKRLAREEIALKVGRVLHRYQMAKHLRLKIGDGVFSWERKQASIDAEAVLDGIYVVRTSEPRHLLSAENTVRSYKRLADVEQAFRSLKSLDLLVRPIHHRLAQRVRAHLFLCLLAYHVQYHMKRALAPLLFVDEDLPTHRQQRDPVLKGEPSASAKQKKAERQTAEGEPVHSFRTLLARLTTYCLHDCEVGPRESASRVTQLGEIDSFQAKVYQLLGL